MNDDAQQGLPILYNGLTPINSGEHSNYRINPTATAPFLSKQHAVPLTVEEFTLVHRTMPIVFSVGDAPVPLALMGLNEGVNVFIDDKGELIRQVYMPAYIRRYPWMLARLSDDTDELSLCFDPSSDIVGPFEEGIAIFEDGKPTEAAKELMQFCEQFEMSAMKTGQFVKELQELELLMPGQTSIKAQNREEPYVYEGFMMVNEEKLRELRGDQLRKMAQNGMLPLIYAHLFSLQVMSEIFDRQVDMGKVPEAVA